MRIFKLKSLLVIAFFASTLVLHSCKSDNSQAADSTAEKTEETAKKADAKKQGEKSNQNKLARIGNKIKHRIVRVNNKKVEGNSIVVEGDKMKIQGWAVDTHNNSCLNSVILEIAGKRKKLEVTESEYAVERYKNEALKNCGFVGRIGTKQFGKGEFECRLIFKAIINDKEREFKSDPYTLTIK